MLKCNYCGEEFTAEEEDDYVKHLVDVHAGELTRVDKRRVQKHDSIMLPDSSDDVDITYREFAVQTAILLAGVAGSLFVFYLLIQFIGFPI